MDLFDELFNITELIPVDFGGGSALDKTYLMAYLVLRNNFKTFVEIGVYKGRSLFPVTYAIKKNNGVAYGIDPYQKDAAREYDIEEDLQKQIDSFIDETDFESIYQNVVQLKSDLGFKEHLEIIRKKSSESDLLFQDIKIDMLHIDGNHDTKHVLEDIKLYLPFLNYESIIVMDDIDWSSVKPAYEKLKETATVIFEAETYAILINSKISENEKNEYNFEIGTISEIVEKLIGYKELIENKNFTIDDMNTELLNRGNKISNLESELNILNNQSKSNKKEIETLRRQVNILNNNKKEIRNLESKISALSKSSNRNLSKNFKILFRDYLSEKTVRTGKLAKISKIPYLFILLKSKGNIKNAWTNIKGYLAINRLNLFDEHYYFNKNNNVLISGINPLIHYLYYGYLEGKNPNAIFDGEYYLNKNKDVKKSKMNPLIHYSLHGIKENRKTNNIKISVIVTSYNHEKYIKECIDSILMQKGIDFELIIGDDFSNDNTRKILEQYQKQHSDIINLLPSNENLGVTKNLKRCLEETSGKYIAICEGDDYWTDPYKLQKQAGFLEERENCALCFNSVLVFYEDNKKQKHIFQEKLTKTLFNTKDLILDNFIGNFSCCMYRSDIVKKLPEGLYEFFTVDWMFNIVCSEYGKIGFLNEPMSTYRVHDSGLWSGKENKSKFPQLIQLIDIYNEFLSFRYDFEFKKYQKRILKLQSQDSEFKKSEVQDIIILDDAFPHPLSAFRLQEYNSYLENFEKIKVYCNPISFPALNEKKSLETIIKNYETKYPQFIGKVERFNSNMVLRSKGIYTIFLNNAYNYIDFIDKYKIPFVFTLYPGGGFELNSEISDLKLKRVLSSPFFKKVIVTQKIVYDYLINNDFCKEDQIKEIFGVVTPLKLLETEYNDKKYYCKDKPTLDICFIAHRYTEKGVDKGYDVFIDVAQELCMKYKNIYFHVVGNFDESIIDITPIKDRINFYGPQLSDWFSEFYKDKDIILSPNIPFKISKGSFDGFPTGCCTEAGLNKVAIFCTDELNLNTAKYKNGEEIVIIPHDTQKILKIIENYYHDPEKLQAISELGHLKIKEIYNYEKQIEPRIKILEELIRAKNE